MILLSPNQIYLYLPCLTKYINWFNIIIVILHNLWHVQKNSSRSFSIRYLADLYSKGLLYLFQFCNMLKILHIRIHFKNCIFPLENIARFFYTMFNVSFLKTFGPLCGNLLSSFPECDNQTISSESFLLKKISRKILIKFYSGKI